MRDPASVVCPLPRVVELVRVSTDSQADKGTPENQRQQLDALRSTRPGLSYHRIEALGVSGAKGAADRKDLQELARLTATKSYDEIRVVNVDRLTRSADPRERMMVYGFAMDAGATIVDCSGRVIDPADSGGMGEIDFYLQTLFAARERTKILARTAAGRRRKAQAGQFAQGRPPYGRRFNKITEAWELVPGQVAIYRRIVADALAGHSVRQIAKRLDLDGVPSLRREGGWSFASIKLLLTTETIIGKFTACGFVTQIPPILSPQEWAQVRAALKTRNSKPHALTERPAMLRGLVSCAGCGKGAVVLSDGAAIKHRYGCPKPSQRAAMCPDRRTIRAEDADAAVRAALLSLLSDSGALNRAILAQDASTPAAAMHDGPIAAKTIEKLDAKTAATLRLMDEGLLTENTARERLASIKDQRAEAQDRLERAGVAVLQPAAKDLSAAADEMRKAMTAASPQRMRELIRILIPVGKPYGLRLTAEGIEIVGRLPSRAVAANNDGQMFSESGRTALLPGASPASRPGTNGVAFPFGRLTGPPWCVILMSNVPSLSGSFGDVISERLPHCGEFQWNLDGSDELAQPVEGPLRSRRPEWEVSGARILGRREHSRVLSRG